MIRFRIATLGTIDEVWKDQTVDVAKIATVERDRLSSEPVNVSPRFRRCGKVAARGDEMW